MDISEKLTEIMSDPEALKNLKQVADSLFSGGQEPATPEINSPIKPAGADDLFGGLDPAAIMSVIGALKSDSNDDRARLLFALKPYLSEKRRERVDGAVKMLKVISVLPILKEQGILKNLLG